MSKPLETVAYKSGSVRWRCNVEDGSHDGFAVLGSGNDLADAMQKYATHMRVEHPEPDTLMQVFSLGWEYDDGSVYNVGMSEVGWQRESVAREALKNALNEAPERPYVLITRRLDQWRKV